MLPKISRYLLVLVTIFTLAYVLPSIYNTLFDTRINMPFMTYSEVKKDYYVMKNIEGKPAFVDRNNKVYSQQEYMNFTPVANFQYHLSRGTLPDSLNGVKLDPRVLQQESFFQFINPDMLYAPEYGVYPLFESEPEFGLKLPEDVFRLNAGVEFIDAKSNLVNTAKSAAFTEVFKEKGFVFPARLVSGIATIMKRRDQGWFLKDASNQLYHFKMVKSKPYLSKIPNPLQLQAAHILCNDFESNEFYALVITLENKLYTINKADYSMSLVPLEHYDPKRQTVMINGTLFNKTFSLIDEQAVRAYTFNRKYQLIDKYEQLVPLKSEMIIGKIFSALFPFQVVLDSQYTSFIDAAVTFSFGLSWLMISFLFVLLSFSLMKKEGREVSKMIPDLLIVAASGIFGFLAVWMFPNKSY